MKQNLLIGLAVALIAALGFASWSAVQWRNAVEANTREIQRQAQEAEARRQAALAHDRAEAQARADDLKGMAKGFGQMIGGDESPTPTPKQKP
jgi:hypothetical protein